MPCAIYVYIYIYIHRHTYLGSLIDTMAPIKKKPRAQTTLKPNFALSQCVYKRDIYFKLPNTLQLYAKLASDVEHVNEPQRNVLLDKELVFPKRSSLVQIQPLIADEPYVNVLIDREGNTKGESITTPLTSCLTGLELAV